MGKVIRDTESNLWVNIWAKLGEKLGANKGTQSQICG